MLILIDNLGNIVNEDEGFIICGESINLLTGVKFIKVFR